MGRSPLQAAPGREDLLDATARAATQRRPPPRYIAEADRLYNLLTDGHPRLRFALSRGYPLRHAFTRKPIRSSYVGRGEWRAAQERHPSGELTPRLMNSFILAKHLQGEYDIAIEWPSWTSLVVFDVDRHLPGRLSEDETHPELVKLANEQRDEVMDELWRAFHFAERPPVVLKTPSGGFHIYMPLLRHAPGEAANGNAERTWPAAWLRERIERHLNQHGIELRPGRLELWPSGTRLRAPCGQRMQLVDNEEFEPRLGTYDRRRGCRRIGPMVRQFCDAIEAARRPLDEWLSASEANWDPTWGPFGRKKIPLRAKGDVCLSRHKVDVSKSLSPEGGHLLFGRAFIARVQELACDGLTAVGERHDAALKLAWYWAVCCGLSEDQVLGRLREWLRRFDHVSNLLPQSRQQFQKQTEREVIHYLRERLGTWGSFGEQTGTSPPRTDVTPPPLDDRDEAPLLRIPLDVRAEARAILRHLAGQASPSGLVPGAVNLSGRILEGVCGQRRVRDTTGERPRRRRAYVVALEHLVRLGVLALHTNYSTGRHGRLYTCWYRFGSGELPKEAETGQLVLAARPIEEGRLEVLSNAPHPPTVRFRARPDDAPPLPAPAVSAPQSASESPLATPSGPSQLEIPGCEPPSPVESCPLLQKTPAKPAEPARVPGTLVSKCTLSEGEAPSQPAFPAVGALQHDASGGPAWWVRMYQRRIFTPAEFLEADAHKMVPGLFAQRFTPRARGQPTLHPGPISPPPEPDAAPAVPEPPELQHVVDRSLKRALTAAWESWQARH